MKKFIIIIIGLILLSSFAAATDSHTWHWLCLNRGEELPGYDKICGGWCCFYCVNEVGDVNPNKCGSAQMCSCDGNVEPDVEPPEMNIISPEEGAVFSSRAIEADVEMSGEPASVYVKNLNKPTTSYYRICSISQHCQRTITVDEGFNHWSFKAVDRVGNSIEDERSFIVDSRPPVIRSTWPRAGGFASKTFGVRYNEEGLLGAELYYKDSGMDGFAPPVPGDCEPGLNKECEIIIPDELAQGDLEYKFCIHDIATEVCSNPVTVKIDTENPELYLVEPENGNIYNSRAVPFDVHTNEPVTLSYIDMADPYHRERTLCSACKDYTRTQSFSDGEHNIVIMAVDAAQNMNQTNRQFTVDSRPPRITSTSPRTRGFGNEHFTVEYNELNVKDVILHYNQSGLHELHGQCEGGLRTACTITADNLLEGPLSYYFEVIDVADAFAKSRVSNVVIDTVGPVLTVNEPALPLYKTRRVPFDLEAVDDNAVSFDYIDWESRAPQRWIRLSSRGSTYQREQSFQDGFHNITIRVTDKAGNYDTYNWNFTVDSRPPRISRSLPRNRGWGNQFFTAIYTEDNPDVLTLYFKHEGDAKFTEIPKTGCNGGRNVKCVIEVAGIGEGVVEYKFGLTDIAGSEYIQPYTSTVTIDTQAPQLNVVSPESGEYTTRYIPFTLGSDEPVTFEYKNYLSTYPQWKRLAYGTDHYDRKLGFNYGAYDVQIKATDSAGNYNLSNHILFDVVQ